MLRLTRLALVPLQCPSFCALQALPRDDSGPPSEVGARRQKFAAFENACSEVAPGLCVGGGAVAQASTSPAGVSVASCHVVVGRLFAWRPPGTLWCRCLQSHCCAFNAFEPHAQNRDTLRTAGITHIVNCVGMLVPNCFTDEIDYLTLFLLGEFCRQLLLLMVAWLLLLLLCVLLTFSCCEHM
jgi:hypothetical protein